MTTTTPQLWHTLTDDERYQRLTDAELQRNNALRLLDRTCPRAVQKAFVLVSAIAGCVKVSESEHPSATSHTKSA